MATYIQNLLDSALGDGARATKFDCDIHFTNRELFPDTEQMRTLVKATQFPGKNHDIIDLKYKGRSIPVKGQVKYNQTWTCTFYLTEDHKLKNAFEVWLEGLDQKHNYIGDATNTSGLRQTQVLHSGSYVSDIMLFQRNFDNSQITAQYTLKNCFPTEISNIEYSAESVGTIQEFTVTFAYSHYVMEVVKAAEGNFIDQFVDKAIGRVQEALSGGLESLNKMAGDSIGSGNIGLDSLKNVNINEILDKGVETASQVSKQLAGNVNDMSSSVFDNISIPQGIELSAIDRKNLGNPYESFSSGEPWTKADGTKMTDAEIKAAQSNYI